MNLLSTNPEQVASVDAFNCLPCEGVVELPSINPRGGLDASAAVRSEPERAVRLRSISRSQEILVADGITTDLGGGCAGGGKARAHCAIIGNQNFELAVWDARASSHALVALSAARQDIPCGSCTIVPHLGLGFVLAAGVTDVVGNAGLVAPLPNDPSLVGGVLYEQWLIVGPGGCFGALEMSNALRVEIQ